MRGADFAYALHNGNAGAYAEDEHGDDEGPEIELEAVPERMPGVGGTGSPVDATNMGLNLRSLVVGFQIFGGPSPSRLAGPRQSERACQGRQQHARGRHHSR
jgi:hypothetical protein